MSHKDSLFSVKDKRQLSSFLTHEMLYDYVMGALDDERKLAVEKTLEVSREARSDLAKIRAGLSYMESLSHTQANTAVVEGLATSVGYIPTLLNKSRFHSWPSGLKWGLEALGVVFAIMIVLTVTPWEKVLNLGDMMSGKEVILAEVEKKVPSLPVVEAPPEFVDEGVKEAAKSEIKTTTEVQKPLEIAKAPVTPEPVKPTVVETKKAAKTDHPLPESGGFLYRGDIAITNIDVVGPKITEKINELGGRKAGSVELGWKRTPSSIYYHFTIPEAKYRDLLTYLDTYGKTKIVKEKHPRVMSDGIIRLIINVDEAKK